MKRLVLIGAVVALLALPAAGLAAHVAPVLHQGNPTCGALGDYDHEFRVDPVSAGTHSDPASDFEVEITIVNTADGPTFNFEANLPVDAVFVKGGPGGNLYVYNPAETSDTGLHAPGNDSGTAVQDPPWSGLSHISFCFSSQPEETPTPTPTPTDTPTPTPTDTPTPTPTDTPTPTPTDTPTPTPGDTPTPTPTPALTPPPTSMSDTGSGSGNILPVLLAGLLAAAFLFLRPAMRFSPVLRKR